MLAVSRLAAALALCAGVSTVSHVYVLAPEGVLDNETQVSVRLSEALTPAAPTVLHAFTLCLWFQVIAFYQMNVIMCYDTASDPAAILLSLMPRELIAIHQGRVVYFQHAFRPLRWYAVCVVVRPTMLLLWMEGKQEILETNMLPLSLDGRLVLGKDQSHTENRTGIDFSGHVTLLGVWDHAFTAQDLDDWGRCRPLNATPLIGWDDLAFTIHNGTAGVIISTAGPCDDGSARHDDVLLFTFKMDWEGVVGFMKNNRLWTDFHAFSHQDQHIKLLTKYSQACKSQLSKRTKAWTGLLYNCSSGEIENLNGISVNATPMWPPNYNRVLKDEFCMSPRPLAVDDHGYWSMASEFEKVCAFAERPDTDLFFNFRLNCQDDGGVTFSYLNFVLEPTKLSQSSGGSVYFHGVQPFVIEDTNNNGTWCLKSKLPAPVYIACTFSFQVPLGIRLWKFVGGPDVALADPCKEINQHIQFSHGWPLILSTCTPEQFTCNDSRCVTLDKVCDMKSDCQAGEDERDCSMIALSYGHFLKTPPTFPLSMTIIVHIKKISNIDLMNFAMSMTLHVTLSWRDSRVEYRHLLPGKRQLLQSRELWTPELWVMDSLEGGAATQQGVEVQRSGVPTVVAGSHLAYKGSENPLWKFQELQVKLFCSYDLRKYPRDRQTCNAVVAILNINGEGLVIDPASRAETCRQLLEEYEVEKCQLLCHNNTNNFTVQVTILRRQEHYILSVYLPSLLLLIIGYSTLHLPVECLNERGTMSLTTLLAFISLYTQTSTSLPKTSYAKNIDLWYVFSLCYLSLIITVHLATCATALSIRMTEGASTPLPQGWMVVPSGRGGGSKQPKASLNRDTVILKTSRVAFSVMAIVFYIFYFINM